MGMFDTLICTRRMPDGFQVASASEDINYQFKEFGCNLSAYELTDEGKLTLLIDRSNGTDLNSHIDYSGELEITATDESTAEVIFHRYLLMFDKSQLTSIDVLD